jgi:putative glutamine amidotransferase
MKKPVIGIVLDREIEGDYSAYPYYVLREHYFKAIAEAGGVPIGLDLNKKNIESYEQTCDGLLLPGGDYDIPPSMYGVSEVHEKTVTKVARLDYDMALTQRFLSADKPILGVCVGEQLLAVMFGGSLVQDIKSEIPAALEHYQGLRTEAVHEIVINPDSKLFKILEKETISVNSHHHQAVKTVGPDMIISATAPDGIVEAIESTKHRFCIGVEWHPEFVVDATEQKIFDAFVEQARKNS